MGRSNTIRSRWAADRLAERFELPMVVLGFVWLLLLVVELTHGLSRPLELIGSVIWALFVFDFVVELLAAPRKGRYLRRNWLTAASLVIPAVRIFRIARLLRFTRGARLVRVVGSVGRSMSAVGATMQRRGVGYVIALTLLVLVAGAAGMLAFEREHGLRDFAAALWWTAMILTTMGSDWWPKTGEGRLLCLLLAIYAFAVFGYVTAAIASFFVGRDAAQKPDRAIDDLRREIRALRDQLHHTDPPDPGVTG